MEFGLSSEQVQLQDAVNRFLADRVTVDIVRRVGAGDETDKTIWTGLNELGIPGLLVPESAGGIGLGFLDAVVVAESLGYRATPAPYLGTAVVAPTVLAAAGNQEGLLSRIASGDSRVGIAFGEAIGARLDAGVNVHDDALTGAALFALDTDADHYLVATGDKKIYSVAADAPGLKRKHLATVDLTRSTCELKFENTPAELVSDDPEVFLHALDAARVMQAADTLGAAQYMFDQAVAYARQRVQFNRPIGSFQAVKHMCAEMAASLEPCRSFVWYAGHALDAVPAERRLVACQVKAHLAEVGQFVARTAIEVYGGMGFTDLVGLHYWFKRIGANRQLLGSPERCREEAAMLQVA